MIVTQQQLADTPMYAEYRPRVLLGAHSRDDVVMWISYSLCYLFAPLTQPYRQGIRRSVSASNEILQDIWDFLDFP